MADLNEVTAKVQRILAKNWRVELSASGGFYVRLESTGCSITCHQKPDDDDDGDDEGMMGRVWTGLIDTI